MGFVLTRRGSVGGGGGGGGGRGLRRGSGFWWRRVRARISIFVRLQAFTNGGTITFVLLYFYFISFYSCNVPMGFLLWKIRVAFSGKIKLPQSRATHACWVF